MTFADHVVQYEELRTDFTQCSPILLPRLSKSRISSRGENNKRLPVGQMVVNNQGTISSLNPKFISIWKLTPHIVTARCEREVWRFIAEQLSNPQSFLVNIRNIKEQMDLEIQDQVKLRNGRSYLHLTKPQWSEKTIVGRLHQFRLLLLPRQHNA